MLLFCSPNALRAAGVAASVHAVAPVACTLCGQQVREGRSRSNRLSHLREGARVRKQPQPPGKGGPFSAPLRPSEIQLERRLARWRRGPSHWIRTHVITPQALSRVSEMSRPVGSSQPWQQRLGVACVYQESSRSKWEVLGPPGPGSTGAALRD